MLVRVKKRLRETASLQDLPRFLYFGNPWSVSGVSVREGGREGWEVEVCERRRPRDLGRRERVRETAPIDRYLLKVLVLASFGDLHV